MPIQELYIRDGGVYTTIDGEDVFVTDDPQVMEKVAREQDDWEEYVSPGKYAKSSSVPRSTPDAEKPSRIGFNTRLHHCLLALEDFHAQIDDPRRKEEIWSQDLINYGGLGNRVSDVQNPQATIRKTLSALFHKKRLVHKTQRGQKAYYSLADAGVLELQYLRLLGEESVSEVVEVNRETNGLKADW